MKIMLSAIMAIWIFTASPAMAYWYTDPCDASNHTVLDTGSSIDFTPASLSTGTVQSWTWAGSDMSDTWATVNMADSGTYVYAAAKNTEGGLVYKFVSSSPVPMELELDALVSFAWYRTRKAVVYYSDQNDWVALNDCAGSSANGWGTEWETNANWTNVDSLSSWSANDGSYHIGTIEPGAPETVFTEDGTFYIRVDLWTYPTCPGNSPRLLQLDVEGTVVNPIVSVEADNTISTTPDTAWSLATDTWLNDGQLRTEFADQIYRYSTNYATVDQQIVIKEIENAPGIGGLVWHFYADADIAMNVTIDPNYLFDAVAGQGRGIDLYFSDEDDWTALETMTGGTWAGGTESNTSWTLLHSDRDNTAAPASIPEQGSLAVSSTDGDFYIRLDMYAESDPCSISLIDLTVLPESVLPTVDTQRTQVFVGNTVDFTPAPGTRDSLWQLPAGNWANDGGARTEFVDEIYTYNDNLVTAQQAVTCAWSEEGYPGVGGMVWHFQMSDPCLVISAGGATLQISALYEFAIDETSRHILDIYFSDENDFSNLQTDYMPIYAWDYYGMTGGVWAGPQGDPPTGWTGREYNDNWKMLYSHREYSGTGEFEVTPADATPDDANEVITADGDFYLRVDLGMWDPDIVDVQPDRNIVGWNLLKQLRVVGALNAPISCQDVWDDGHGMPLDYNQDCEINLPDLSWMASEWLNCNDPHNTDCMPTNW